jgi:hypothetical protein
MQPPQYGPPMAHQPVYQLMPPPGFSHQLQLHFSALAWPAIQFYTGYSTCSSPRQIRNFFALFSVEDYRTAAACYLQTPDRWDSESHPYYSEPAPDSELYNLTREVYGVETLFQISQTPVITSRNKFMLDDVIVYALKPFYPGG